MAAHAKLTRQDSIIDTTTPVSKLQIQEEIGRGSFATVYRAHLTEWGHDVAYKKFKISYLDPTSDEEQK